MSDKTVSILIVDDNAQDRAALKRYLHHDSETTYSIVEQPTVEEALTIVREWRPDCILLDHHLPDGTGLEFMTELREAGLAEHCAVVMMTGTGSESIAVEAMKAGIQDYLIKGLAGEDEVLRAIKGALFRVKAERMMEQQRQELKRLYQEVSDASQRKDQLLADLKAAKDAAERANAAKDEFLAALSHELRTPLTPILSAVSAIDPVTAERGFLVETFAVIRRNIELEARLIDDLLDITRIARGKLRVERQLVDLHLCLKHAEEICAPEMARKQIHVERSIGAAQHHTLGDAARLQQVFWNVLANAVKFTPEGGRIFIDTRNSPDSGIEVVVSDTGIGIPKDHLKVIFNAFEQGRPPTAKRFDGLGLGLAIAKALVEAQSGAIFAQSEGPGRGCSIHIELPFTEQAIPMPIDGNGATPPRLATGQLNLLLVEDHQDSAQILSRLLRQRGYQVQMAHSLAEARAVFNNHAIDLVISDIGLPDGTGSELIQEFNAIRQVPSIAISGFGMEQDLARSRAAGFGDHLIKPITVQKLEDAIRRVL